MEEQRKANMLAHMETQNKIYNILTPEQKKQFNANFEKRLTERPAAKVKCLQLLNNLSAVAFKTAGLVHYLAVMRWTGSAVFFSSQTVVKSLITTNVNHPSCR